MINSFKEKQPNSEENLSYLIHSKPMFSSEEHAI